MNFVEKSFWQKDDCINNSSDHRCTNRSFLEAVCGTARVRCCGDPACKQRAAELARKLAG